LDLEKTGLIDVNPFGKRRRDIRGDRSMSLVGVVPGQSVEIVDVKGGHGLKRRLAAMGLVRGQEVEVIYNNRGGPLVVAVMGGRLMMGRGMARRIIVN
jgi:Fe2+ transport system protein FeoA